MKSRGSPRPLTKLRRPPSLDKQAAKTALRHLCSRSAQSLPKEMQCYHAGALAPLADFFPLGFFEGGALTSRPQRARRGILLDIQETEAEYRLQAEVPGVPREAIRVTADGGVLSVAVEQSKESSGEEEQGGATVHRSERASSFASRSIRLPEAADLGAVTARLDRGVLSLCVPKRPDEGRRTITVE